MNTNPRQYGWKAPKGKPSPKQTFRANRLVRVANPPAVDLRPTDSPIENQGDLGSCTSFGWGGAAQFAARNAPVAVPALSFLTLLLVALRLKRKPVPPAPAEFTASKLFIYYNERAIEGTTADDDGAAVADGAKVVSTLGVAPDADWPYVTDRYALKPPAAAYADATKHLLPAPLAVDNTDLDEVRTALANKHPVVFGFYVYASFEDLDASDATYRPSGRYMGGHCVCAVGYDDAKQVLIVRNSWGTEWADKGYFYMPYEVFTDARVTSDAWALAGDPPKGSRFQVAAPKPYQISIDPATVKLIEQGAIVAVAATLGFVVQAAPGLGSYGPVVGAVATIALTFLNKYLGQPVAKFAARLRPAQS